MARSREFDTGKAVDAAIELFRRRGFEGVSIQEIVAATGIGRGSLYAAFGSKEGIYHAALERYRAVYADPLTELLACRPVHAAVAREFARNFTSATSAARILDIAALGSQRRGAPMKTF